MRVPYTRQIHLAGILAYTLLLLQVAAGDAAPRLFGIDMQATYNFWEQKDQGRPIDSRSYLTTSYGLSFRRPLSSSMNVVSDLSVNTTAVDDFDNRRNTQGVLFNLYSNKPTYTLTSRYNYNNYRYYYDGPLNSFSSNSASTSFIAGMLLRNPAYPLVNLQYQRTAVDSGPSGLSTTRTSDTTLVSGRYNLKPLQFTYDRTQRSTGGDVSPVDSITQRGAVTLTHPLFSGLEINGELSKYLVDGSGITQTDMNSRSLRLTATPTRALSANLDYRLQSNTLQYLSGKSNYDTKTFTFNARSEIFPGCALDYTEQRQDYSGRTYTSLLNKTLTNNRRLDFSMRLNGGTVLSSGIYRLHYDIASPTQSSQTEDNVQIGLQTPLTPVMDLNLDLGRFRLTQSTLDENRQTFGGIGIRSRGSEKSSYGISYRRSSTDSALSGTTRWNQRTDSWNFDALLQPRLPVSMNLRLNYLNNIGTNPYTNIEPGINFRWKVTPRTNLTIDYGYLQSDQWDPLTEATLSQKNRLLSMNMLHWFHDGSSLNLIYYYNRMNFGDIEWRRQLQLRFIKRL